MGSVRIMRAFDDPEHIVSLVRRHGPYPSITSYLPAAATEGDGGGADGVTDAWFRGNWAANGRVSFDECAPILDNPRFAQAASEAVDDAEVQPTTIVVNVNAPMPAGAVHVDIASFRGAGRNDCPLPLLQAMGTSGLFEPWRIVEVGAVTWFYDGPGGAYDYWPDGLAGPMHSVSPPYSNTSLVADNDRMYHRIGAIGPAGLPTRQVPVASSITHRDDRWDIVVGDHVVDSYSDTEVRLSILWKALVVTDEGGRPDPLTADQIVSIIVADLARRNVEAAAPDSLDDSRWLDVVHRTYYPPIRL